LHRNKTPKAKKQLAKTSHFSVGTVKDFRGTELLSRFFCYDRKCLKMNKRKLANISYIATKKPSRRAGFSSTRVTVAQLLKTQY
jgi:hypothetical protein